MKKKDLAYFKNLLTHWLEELLTQGNHTIIDLRKSDDHFSDFLDQSVFDSDQIFTLRIRDRERMLINKIKSSLEDIETGEYGICADCGEEIPIERLKIRPVAKRCIRCKTKQENFEKTVGF